MGFTDLWNRTLVYFGIAEDEEWDDDGHADQRAARGGLPAPRPQEREAAAEHVRGR